MKISKTHQKFADYLNNQNVLNHPEFYLGPNWEELINFWLYLDTLTEDQLRVVETRYLTLSYEEYCIAYNKACRAASVTTKFYSSVGNAVYYRVSCAKFAAYYATLELINLDKILEQGYKPVFFPLFLNP